MINRLKLLNLSSYEEKEADRYYRRYHREMIPHLSYTDFIEFSKTGARLGYEKKYFARRNRLNSTFMMYFIYGKKYANELFDLIWAICDEFTWALPAHASPDAEAYKCIDLFNAETAMTLTEIAYFMGDDLPASISGRIVYEVTRRVIEPFEAAKQQWESAKHNWAAVCGGCIGMIYLYRNEDVPKRIFDALNCYISGFNDDGVCLEGLGYWSYGFGYFMYFAALLNERKGICIYNSEKTAAIAQFQQNMYFGPDSVSCSDCSPDTAPLMGLTGLLCELFPDSVRAPQVRSVRLDECGRWAHFIRSYLYKPPSGENLEFEARYHLSQWYMKHTKECSIFAKGGNNDEPHNHNDVGSFILADKHGQVLCDIGCGEYTADYFDAASRYDHLCSSSLGHSVPIIDGHGQLAGGGYSCDRFECGGGCVSISFGKAYGDDVSAVRQLRLYNGCFKLKDEFSFSGGKPHKVVERFVSRLCPKELDGRLYIGKFHTESIPHISVQIISDHNGKEIPIYLMDFEVSGNRFEVEFKL